MLLAAEDEPEVTTAEPEQVPAPAATRAEPTTKATAPQRPDPLLTRLTETTSELTIRVNGVELSLDVIDVNRTPNSICCLVRFSGLRCRIPNSENVVILLDGQELKAVFVGAWHSFDWLNIHVVVFPICPEEPSKA